MAAEMPLDIGLWSPDSDSLRENTAVDPQTLVTL